MFWLAEQLFGVVIVLAGGYFVLTRAMDFLVWLTGNRPKNAKNH